MAKESVIRINNVLDLEFIYAIWAEKHWLIKIPSSVWKRKHLFIVSVLKETGHFYASIA